MVCAQRMTPQCSAELSCIGRCELAISQANIYSLEIMATFGSTYVCEQFFSSMKINKFVL